MAVPKKRTSRRRKGMRRAHDALSFNAAVVFCERCGLEKLAHHVCDACGYYRDNQFFITDFNPSGGVDDGVEEALDPSTEASQASEEDAGESSPE